MLNSTVRNKEWTTLNRKKGIYSGDWANSKPHGTGTITFSGRSAYTGDWEDGNRHGFGTLTYPDGNQCTGFWKNDEFVEKLAYICNVSDDELPDWIERMKNVRDV